MMETEARELLKKPTCSVPEFAEIVGMSRNAAYIAIQRGDVKAIRIGKKIVVPTKQIRQMLDFEDTGSRMKRA